MKCLFRGRFLPVAAVLSTLGLSSALSAAPAQAALVNTSACDGSALTQPFARWGDTNYYKLVPGGSFRSGLSGWTASGGARLVSGGEPFGVTGSVGASALSLPAGSSVQSPYTCVDAAYPSLRFFVRNNSLLSTVLVSLVYKAPLVGLVPIPVGTVLLGGAWKPTAAMPTLSAVPGLLTGGITPVAVRFTALLGSSEIDDVYLDPRCRG